MKEFVERVGRRLRRSSVIELEQKVYEREDSIRALPSAPERFKVDSNLFSGSMFVQILRTVEWLFHAVPVFPEIGKDTKASFASLDENPSNPRDHVTSEFVEDFEAYAKSLGIGAIGYKKLPREAIFKGKAVLFDQVIVLTMEMPKAEIDMAPSRATLKMVMGTYRELGSKINILVDYLRKNGYAAQAGRPLGGLSLYPLIAEKAGLGWHGRHGLLISPRFGARQRIGVIYTNIRNLPIHQKNEHKWIKGFCEDCGKCIKMCPGKAIYEEPIIRSSGVITHIDAEKCFSEFTKNYGCSVCIKECAFNEAAYDDLKRAFERKQTRE